MAKDEKRLLEYIVKKLVVPEKVKEAQLDASAVEDVALDAEAITSDSRSDIDRFAPYFERGLALARASGGTITVDDSEPEGNGIAEAFARFLVIPGLATSQTTDLPEGHYRYKFEVDLRRLGELGEKSKGSD